MSTEVVHDRKVNRFSVTIEGATAHVEYREPDADTVDFLHTFTPPELRGRGVARVIVDSALEWARGEGKRIIPTCWYVRKVLEGPDTRES
jgi:predicted GNAT family acetyltransferase